jgi:hypothetical protein
MTRIKDMTPNNMLTVTNPKVHEILEEAFEEWRKWQ